MFFQELESIKKADESRTCPKNVLNWNDDNPPPPPTCGGGDGQMGPGHLIC